MDDLVLLWDFDGTLVDTAALWRSSEYAFLASRNLPWNDDASRQLIGGNLDLMSNVMADVTGVRFGVEELQHGLLGLVGDALSRHVPWMPGIERLLREQHEAGHRSALVTSSYASLVEIALASLPFSPFETIVARDDVERPKPDAEPYALALERLGAVGSQAVAIEDSIAGVTSALAAGCHVIAVGDHVAHVSFPAKRVRHLDSLADVGLDIIAAPLINRL